VGEPEMMSMMTWQDRAGGASSSLSAAVLETLVDDLILKQLALERIVRASDTNEARCEMAVWRLQDAENRVKTLTADNTQLRQYVHEEKEANRIPAILENSANLTREELIERTEAALAAYGRERRRNAELVHRLQQMHAEQVDTLELKRRYQELQMAHMSQAKLVNEQDSREGKLSAYRTTVKTQEEVIANLERLLAQAVSKAKAVGEVEAQNQKLRKAMDMMRGQFEQTAQNKQLADSMAMHSQLETMEMGRHEALQENLALQLKLKQAEDRAGAAHDEMIEAVKRYAQEIADLKWKLAEKDAQLMGGFGDVTRLRNLDDNLGIPMVLLPPSQGTPTRRASPGMMGRPRINSADSTTAGPPHLHRRHSGGTLSAGGSPTVGSPVPPPFGRQGSRNSSKAEVLSIRDPSTPDKAGSFKGAGIPPDKPGRARQATASSQGDDDVELSSDEDSEEESEEGSGSAATTPSVRRQAAGRPPLPQSPRKK